MSATVQEYIMIIEPDTEDGNTVYHAYFPDLPGTATFGRTMEELEDNAQEMLSEYIEAMRDSEIPVPPPSSLVLKVTVSI